MVGEFPCLSPLLQSPLWVFFQIHLEVSPTRLLLEMNCSSTTASDDIHVSTTQLLRMVVVVDTRQLMPGARVDLDLHEELNRTAWIERSRSLRCCDYRAPSLHAELQSVAGTVGDWILDINGIDIPRGVTCQDPCGLRDELTRLDVMST